MKYNKLQLLVLVGIFICSITSKLYTKSTLDYIESPNIHANSTALTGVVLDSETSQPISGVSVKIQGTAKGAYTAPNGRFRIPCEDGFFTVSFTSIGYETAVQKMQSGNVESYVIRLKPSAVKLQAVEVSADISGNEVVRRAIANKINNTNKISFYSASLYTKLRFEIDGSFAGRGPEEKDKALITETISKIYEKHKPTLQRHVVLEQRRQTRNLNNSFNVNVLTQFVNFFDERIIISNGRIVSPLASDALDYYDFTILSRVPLGDRIVYEIQILPKITSRPLFEGKLWISDNSYELVEIKVKPVAASSLQFIKELEFYEKFELMENDIWVPSYLQVSGGFGVDVIKGVSSFKGKAVVVSMVTDQKVNIQLPDSLFSPTKADEIKPLNSRNSDDEDENPTLTKKDTVNRTYSTRNGYMTILKDVDSAKSEYWNKKALVEVSAEEQEIYRNIDSLVQKDSIKSTKNEVEITYFPPLVRLNRVAGVEIGFQPTIQWKRMKFDASINYATHTNAENRNQHWYGSADMVFDLYLTRKIDVRLTGSIYSRILSFQEANFLSTIVNSFSFGFAGTDYYDYFRRDGFGFELQTLFGNKSDKPFNFSVGYSKSNDFSLSTSHIESVSFGNNFRNNYSIDEGSYQLLNSSLSWKYDPFRIIIGNPSSVSLGGRVSAFYGSNSNTHNTFQGVSAVASVLIPTFETGYAPMTLSFLASGGTSSESTPRQFRYVVNKKLPFLDGANGLYSIPLGKIGGTEFISISTEYNTSDYFWRVLGLPLFEGRGLEVIGIWNGVRTNMSGVQNLLSPFFESTNGWYYEAGFALGRIPVFISNILYLRTNFVWGVGKVGAGNFGFTMTITSPL